MFFFGLSKKTLTIDCINTIHYQYVVVLNMQTFYHKDVYLDYTPYPRKQPSGIVLDLSQFHITTNLGRNAIDNNNSAVSRVPTSHNTKNKTLICSLIGTCLHSSIET